MAANPHQTAKWNKRQFADEPNLKRFERGTLSFAGSGVDSRTCHLFIAFGHNNLGTSTPHETNLGQVTLDTMATLDTIEQTYKRSGYKDLTSLQGRLVHMGNKAAQNFPMLDRIHHCQRLDGKKAHGHAHEKHETEIAAPGEGAHGLPLGSDFWLGNDGAVHGKGMKELHELMHNMRGKVPKAEMMKMMQTLKAARKKEWQHQRARRRSVARKVRAKHGL